MKIVLVLFTLLVSTVSYAASYQAQGCGLGSTIWTDGSNLTHQVLGATTNASSLNTVGMTLGTSNCELDAGAAQAQLVFIEANLVALEENVAQGQGETLTAYLRIGGCQNIEHAQNYLQQNFGPLFDSKNPSVIRRQFQKVLNANKACI